MTCHYCGFSNDEEDHRCNRCGRRLTDGFPPSRVPRPLRTATAPAMHAVADRAPEPPKKAAKPGQYQPSLFSSREYPRVVPFETLVPVAPAAPERAAPGKPRARAKRATPGQQSFGFETSAARVAPPVEAAIYCDALVADPARRIVAAAADWVLVLAALGVLYGVLRFSPVALDFTKHTLPFYAAGAVLVAAFYKLLWCMGNSDSPGTCFSALQLVDFDGRRPTRRQRFQRAASSCLSFCSGLGLVWALLDEEQLTWQDYMSKTFPTPRA